MQYNYPLLFRVKIKVKKVVICIKSCHTNLNFSFVVGKGIAFYLDVQSFF